ncbi:MAG: hypothetical protein JWL63_115 [Rhodocyclales bacterium]|nr:hypothetical protein [Rhodocyclales bacterium]
MSLSFRQMYLAPYVFLSGRLQRSRFNWLLLVLIVVFVVLFVFIDATFGHPQTLVLYPFLAWGALALSTQRLHDHGKSMAWLLLLLIPVFGPLWCFITLCCRAGSSGENQYGEDLLSCHADYLTV